MIAPVHRLKKDEIIWLKAHVCKHRHTYLEHYNCFLEEQPSKQLKIGFFDIETSNLQADFGIMLCYVIKEAGKEKYHYSLANKKDLNECLDRKVIEQCVKDILKFDMVVTHYGTKFDLPFLRTRALYWGIDFPEYGTIKHKDVYYIAKSKLRLSSNRQVNIAQVLSKETHKTPTTAAVWIPALRGDKKALKDVLDHCMGDVIDLENNYNKLIGFSRPGNRSI